MEPVINKDYLGCFGTQKIKIKPKAIILHHTCTSSSKRTRRVLQSKNYSTHFEVDKDGTIYQYREENLKCSHCGSANTYTIGIDATHLEHAEFPEVQIEALKALVKYLCEKWNIPHELHENFSGPMINLSGVYPHRAIGNTKCPDNLPLEKLFD